MTGLDVGAMTVCALCRASARVGWITLDGVNSFRAVLCRADPSHAFGVGFVSEHVLALIRGDRRN